MKKSIIQILIVLFFLTIIFLKGEFQKYLVIKEHDDLKHLVDLVGDIEQVWRNGHLCKGQNVDINFYKCNPLGLRCFLEERGEYIGDPFYSIINRETNPGPNTPRFAYKVTLRKNKAKLNILLEDSCRDVYLPSGTYKVDTTETLLNLQNRKIFIDKFLVSFNDISEFNKFSGSNIKIGTPYKSATGLTEEQMQKYCAYRGKQVLNTAIFDAATFSPNDFSNPGPEYVRNYKPFTSECVSLFSKECLDFYIPYFYPYGVSWIGMYQSFGGPMEFLYPIFNSFFNVKSSSYYFDAGEDAHILTSRIGFVDNKVNPFSNYGRILDLPESVDIGFRCYFEVAGSDI